MAKKQTKVDKAFIDKIKSIGIKVSTGKAASTDCPDCGEPMQKVGEAVSFGGGAEIHADVYSHGPLPEWMLPRGKSRRNPRSKNEQSFSA